MFRSVAKIASAATIDVTMYWPPDHDGIHFLFGIGKDKHNWDFEIPSSHWQLVGEAKDNIPAGLMMDIRHLFREIWKDVFRHIPDTQAYLRLHDDIDSIDLRNGRRISDSDRADYSEPNRMPFRKPPSLKKSRRQDHELIRRGDSLSKVKKAYGVAADPESEPTKRRDASYWWPDLGIRIWFCKAKVESVYYSTPFPHKICGVWIGAHAWQVNELLGRADKESFWSDYSDYKMGGGTKEGFPPRLRIWEYGVDGYLWLRFNDRDCVATIGR